MLKSECNQGGNREYSAFSWFTWNGNKRASVLGVQEAGKRAQRWKWPSWARVRDGNSCDGAGEGRGRVHAIETGIVRMVLGHRS